MQREDTIPVSELKRLLYEIRAMEPEIKIRFRLIGELWQTHHCRIALVTEKGVAVVDELSRKLLVIEQLDSVMQFELDSCFGQYEPNYHYSIEGPEKIDISAMSVKGDSQQ